MISTTSLGSPSTLGRAFLLSALMLPVGIYGCGDDDGSTGGGGGSTAGGGGSAGGGGGSAGGGGGAGGGGSTAGGGGSTLDGGTTDAGATDGGTTDAGTTDAGFTVNLDAGAPVDAGLMLDGGLGACGEQGCLVACTNQDPCADPTTCPAGENCAFSCFGNGCDGVEFVCQGGTCSLTCFGPTSCTGVTCTGFSGGGCP